MIRHRLSLIFLGLMLASPAAAQIMGRPFEFSGQVGWNHYDTRAHMQAGPGVSGRVGWRTQPWLVLEGQVYYARSKADTVPKQDHSLLGAALDLRLNLRSPEGRAVPFLLAGGGVTRSSSTGHPPDQLKRGSGEAGIGMLFDVAGNQRLYVRTQVTDLFFRDRGAHEFSNDFSVTAGLQYLWGGKPHDSDLDGVRDWLDTCPATPLGCKVDAKGCPTDSDGDGVCDGVDKCPNTPAGCKVDKKGCPTDTDGDGVCDDMDTCPNTPKGCTVDAHGCPLDSDGDGVCDGVDQCPNTAKGCTVDEKGCPADADKDGVCDGVDMCPNTPEGLLVDAKGCPVEVSEKEVELLDTGMIRLQNINFDTGKSTIKPESYPVLAEVAKILQQYPTLRIQIGGHTDNRGSDKINDTLSTARAAAVLDYMKQTFPAITSSQFTSKGFGSSQPIAPNTTELGRAKNRRVEFKVMNTEALRIERERRRPLRKDEGVRPAPAAPDTTKGMTPSPAPPDTTKGVAPKPAPPDTAKGGTPRPAAPDTTKHMTPGGAPPDTTKK